jgi:ElaB/YqjD/DUF883 family membrane-anchored ribosome-binding protein
MDTNQEPSLDELRREANLQREALTSTVGELKERVAETTADIKVRMSPAHIKKEVQEYVRDGAENLWQSIERQARENPLQAIAVGAGIGYPLWGIIRKIPTPLLLIGAGFWLAKKDNRFLQQAQETAGQVAANVKEKASQFADDTHASIKAAGHEIADRLTNTANSAASQLSAVGDGIVAGSREAKDKIGETSQTVLDAVQDAAAQAAEGASAAATDAKERLVTAGVQSRDAITDLVERNPLLVAGLGLAVGAFVAACLPATPAERRIVGPSADSLKDSVRELGAKGIARARNVTNAVASDVVEAASHEGIDAQGVSNAVRGFVSDVKSVAERSVDAALGENAPPNPPTGQQR